MNLPGGFPIDLILFGLIAAFLILRLRSILGRRIGFEGRGQTASPVRPTGRANAGRPEAPVIEGRVEAPAARPARPMPDPAGPIGTTLRMMRDIDRGFDPTRFLDTAETSFRTIVAAFASGDRVALRGMLTDETYRAFETAIAARETASETQRTEIKEVTVASITDAALREKIGEITVRFVSDQINLTLGRDNQPKAGTDAVTEIADLWTFERDLGLRDPVWRLAAARSA
jgi:predicted lipid-binding transport protein (Tim44 family)